MYKFYLYHTDLQKPTLIRTPQGWDSNTRILNRDASLHGVFTNFTEKLNFIKDGKRIIHTIYERYGVEAVIIITIYKLSKITNQFELQYKGKLNLTTFSVNQTFVSCNIENTGFLQQFYNQQTVKYSVSDSGVTNITLPSIILRKKIVGSIGISDTTVTTTLPLQGGNVDNYLLFSLTDYTSQELDTLADGYPYQMSTTTPMDNLLYTLKAKEKMNVTLSGNMFISVDFLESSANTLTVKWWATYGKAGSFTTVQVGATQAGGSITLGHLFYSPNTVFAGVSFTLNPFDEFYFYATLSYTGGNKTADFTISGPSFTASNLTIQGDTFDNDSTANVIPVFEFVNNLIGKMTGQANRLRSNFYGRTENGYAADGAGSLRVITNGNQIKQRDLGLKPIYGQFDQCLKTLKALDNVGVGHEIENGIEYIRVEPIEYFYPKTELFKLENVLDIEKSVIAADYGNALAIGYEKYDYSKLTALDEFNTQRQFTFPITQLQKTISYLSPYIGSGYTIELLRRDRLNTSTTKDSQADEENAIIQMRRDGSGNLVVDRDEDFAVINNLIAGGTMYNLKLSPERMVYTHGGELRSFLEKYVDQKLTQTSSVGNSQMSTKLDTETAAISESDDIEINSFSKPRYLSEQYSFVKKLTEEQIDLMYSNPLGYISFRKTSSVPYSRMYIMKSQSKGEDGSITFTGRRANI